MICWPSELRLLGETGISYESYHENKLTICELIFMVAPGRLELPTSGL